MTFIARCHDLAPISMTSMSKFNTFFSDQIKAENTDRNKNDLVIV